MLFFTPLLASENAKGGSSVYNVGLFRPRIDGFLEPALPDRISEWNDDSASLEIKLQSADGSSHAADLRVKSIGPDFYFALDVEYPVQPQVYLVLDLDMDGQADQMVASIGEHSLDLIHQGGEWVPVGEEMTIGLAATLPSGQADHWITEIGHVGLPDDTDEKRIGWNLRIIHPETGEGFWFPPQNPDCPFPDGPSEPWPPLDKWCFQPMDFTFDLEDGPFDWILPANPKVERIEVTQAIQTEDNDMPLVLGKTSMARVFVDPDGVSREVTVTLYGSEIEFLTIQIGQITAFWQGVKRSLGSMTRTFTAPVDPDRESIVDSANFVLPTDWTEVELLGLYAEVACLNCVQVPKGITFIRFYEGSIFSFEETHDLVTYIVRIDEGGVLPSDATIQAFTENMTNTYPMANPSYPMWRESIGPWTGTGQELLVELTKIAMQIAGEISFQSLQGLPITLEFPDQVFGARSTNVGGLSDPVWFGGDSLASWGGQARVGNLVMAHEVMHNIGPDDNTNGHYGRHIDVCAGDLGDPDWTAQDPTGNGEIQDVGWTPSVSNPETNQAALIAPTRTDFMTDCANSWISTYRWEKLFDRLQNWVVGRPGLRNGYLDDFLTIRVIQGTIPLTGTPTMAPTYEAPGILPDGYVPSTATSDQYTAKVVVRREGGSIQQTIYIDPVYVDVEGNPHDEYHFVYFVPDNGNITAVELLDDQDNVTQSYSSIDSPVVDFTSVPSSFQRGEPALVSWTGMAPSSPFLQYQVEYSHDNVTWFPIGPLTTNEESEVTLFDLPGSTEGRLRLRATNGFDTAYAISSPFTLGNQQPSISISGVDLEQSVRSHLSFKASVSDPDMGVVDPEEIVWSLDGDEIDQGRVTDFVAHSAGKHTLKAEYTDSSGAKAEDSIEIDCINRPFPTTEALEEFEDALILDEDGEEEPPWWLILLAIVLIVIAIVIISLRRRP